MARRSRPAPSHTGRCACGAVTFSVAGPLRPVVVCHCESCRRQSGHQVAATAAPAEMLSVEGGENLSQWQATDRAVRRFCRTCGSHLFWQEEGSDEVSIMAGAFDPPTGLELSHHIFVAEKSDYYEITDGLPAYPGESRPS